MAFTLAKHESVTNHKKTDEPGTIGKPVKHKPPKPSNEVQRRELATKAGKGSLGAKTHTGLGGNKVFLGNR